MHRRRLGWRQKWGQRSLDGDGAAPGRVSRFRREKVVGLGPGPECQLGQRKRCPKGAPNMQSEAGDNLRGGYQQRPTRLRDPEGPPKVGNTDELIFKEYVTYIFK